MMKNKSQLYHAGIATFMGAKWLESPSMLSPGSVAVVGVPFDYTCGSRPGARWGPRAIRQSSMYVEYFLNSSPDQVYVDVGSGNSVEIPENFNVYDLGDIELFPTDINHTMETIASYIKSISEKGVFPLIMGGDHFITIPAFQGYTEGTDQTANRAIQRTGYIHLDSHLDIFEDNPPWGKFYHGSTVRRIAEAGRIDPSHMLLIGGHGLVGKESWDFLQRNCIKLLPLQTLRAEGIEPCIKQALEQLTSKVDRIYLSIDIDVVCAAFAPGTGGISLDGLRPNEFLSIVDILADYPIGALDLVEVAPNFDTSERTQRLAAEALFTFLLKKRIQQK